MSRTKTLLLMPIFIVLAAWLYWQQSQRIFEDKGRLKVYEENGSVVMEWHTNVRLPMDQRFTEAFKKWGDQTNEFIIDLHSNGGALREGSRVIESINRMKSSHKITTRVQAGNSCLSMCVPIFLQGDERVAYATSQWMFHEPQAYDYFDGSESNQPEFERRYYSNRFFEKYFTNSVISAQWRETLRQKWVGKDVWKSGQQLVDENSNIITRLKP